jgi:hypothetical protein
VSVVRLKPHHSITKPVEEKMSENKADGLKDNNESFLSTIIPMFFTVAVSVATFMVMNVITDKDETNVLVYSISDWIPVTDSEQLTQEQISQRLKQGSLAVERASEAGYIVIHSKHVIEAPESSRLKPGMFGVSMGDE